VIPANNDTSSFFGQHDSGDVPRDQWGRYELPDPRTGEKTDGWTRATTFAATIAEQYALRVWKERQVVWGLSRRPDLITMASTISGPEDKKALGAIVEEAHIAAGTQAKANRGTSIHRACQASELGRHHEVPEELRPHVAGFFKAVRDAGLELLPEYVERVVIVERYHVAGQLDNLVRCPDGKIRVLDKKTGRMDYSDVEFAVQQAVYAHADAMFNYATGRYEPAPEIATDYAILAHIDPDTGHCELLRINIEWGWLWARTCAEVMDIRKTKHVITPYVPETVATQDVFAPRADFASPAGWVGGDETAHLWLDDRGAQHVHWGPLNRCDCSKGPRSPFADRLIREQPGATQRAADADQLNIEQPAGHPSTQVFVGAPAVDTSAYWLDEDDAPDLTMNSVPVAQYGQPSTWPCARGEACVPTGTSGLHPDGTVCLFGNARPGPVPVRGGEEIRFDGQGRVRVLRDGQWVLGAEQTLDDPAPEPTDAELTWQSMSLAEREQNPDARPDMPTSVPMPAGQYLGADHPAVLNAAPDDAMVEKIMKTHKDKAAMQKLATRLMSAVGVTEGDPDGIKLAQYKADLANAIVTLAYRRGVPVPGPTDDAPLGVPTGPGHPKKTGKSAAKKSAKDTAAEDAVAKEHDAAIRSAVASINQQTSIEGLTQLHDHYATNTRVGWTAEMQVAARTRAAELDAAAGTEALTPAQMIAGATSMETLSRAYQVATSDGERLGGWTAELNDAAQAKSQELQRLTTSVKA